MFTNLYEQWKICTKSEKTEDELTSYEVQEILEFHPYNYCDQKLNPKIYEQLRDDYYGLWDEQKCMERIISEFEQIKKNSSREGNMGNTKFPSMIYCITISPPDEFHTLTLVKLLQDILGNKQVIKSIGVFEVGRKRNNFHTHFLIECNHKQCIQNIKKKLNTMKMVYKVDKIISSVHLLKTLRYLFNKEKLNKGIIHKPALSEWLVHCNLNNSNFLNEMCITTEYEGRVWNM